MTASDHLDWLVPIGPQFTGPQRTANSEAFGEPESLLAGHLSWVPWVLEEAQLPSAKNVHVDVDLSYLLFLVVSQDNSCRYCHGAARSMLQIIGHRIEQIETIEEALFRADLPGSTRTALDFARRLSRSNPRLKPEDARALQAAGWSSPAALEIGAGVAVCIMLNRITILICATDPTFAETLMARWYAPLVRPVMARLVRRSRRLVGPEPLEPQYRDQPFGGVVAMLDGLPAANAWGRVLAGMWASTVLPVRTKAMMIGVVARALECTTCEREAVSVLATAGIDEARSEEIFRTLGSSELDDIERRLVPFARETVRYEHEVLQRRAREVLGVLEPAQAVEAIGVLALANAFARLSALLDIG